MESCVFECEDFPKENQKQANRQLTLVKLKVAIFYIRCCHFVVFNSVNFHVSLISPSQQLRIALVSQIFIPQTFSIRFECAIPQLAKVRILFFIQVSIPQTG